MIRLVARFSRPSLWLLGLPGAKSVAQDTGKTRTRPSIRCSRSWQNPVRVEKPAKEPEKHEKDAKPDRKPAEPASKAKPGTDAKPKPAGGQSAKPADRENRFR